MLVDVMTKNVSQINIDSEEAFKILCKTLNMEFVLDDSRDFFVSRDCYGHRCVYIHDGLRDKEYDDRGDLFIAHCRC